MVLLAAIFSRVAARPRTCFRRHRPFGLQRRGYDSNLSPGYQRVSCQLHVALWRQPATGKTISDFEALGDDIDLAAPVPRRLRLAHIDFGESLLRGAPQGHETLALERFEHEIAARLQPCRCKFERQLAKMHRSGLIRR